MTEKQARALAYLLHEIRPDWGITAMVSLFGKHHDSVPSLGALMIAATTKALEPSCRTPGPIFQSGPHWPDASAAERFLPKPPACEDHKDYEGPTCRCCHADVKIGQRPHTHIGRHWNPDNQPTESETET